MTVVFLDSGPLGLVTNPRGSPMNDGCRLWLESLLANGIVVVVPEIADYEVRRELLRANRAEGLERLDWLKTALTYLPLTTETMLLAAALWAEARRGGRPTTDPMALDADVILAAQARLVERDGTSVTVATTNTGHLARFIHAAEWQQIPVS